MKKRLSALLLAAVLMLSGCSLYEAEYSWSEPYSGALVPVGGDAAEVRNLSMLKSALLNLISAHAESGALSFQHYSGSAVDDLAAVCLEIRTENPLGAYAVESIGFDTSRIVSYYVADVSIVYKRTAEEIRAVQEVFSREELSAALTDALARFDRSLALRVYTASVDTDYLAALVRELYFADPAMTVAEPELTVESYPAEGANRIYALSLSYGRAPGVLEEKSRILRAAVAALAAEAPEGDETARALWCARTVYALLQDGAEPSGAYAQTPYGALVEHSADSKGAATAMQLLCTAVGVECRVVAGSIGAMGAEEHYWNILTADGETGHADAATLGAERPVFGLSDESLWGTYTWSTDAYPACAGISHYDELFPAPPEETPEPEPAETAPPEPSPPLPAETEMPKTEESGN